jgi:predicted neuraminidase
LIYNHSASARSPLNLAVSRDGDHWRSFQALEAEPGEYSYPAMIQGSDGQLHITYTWRRERIRYVEWPLDRIP